MTQLFNLFLATLTIAAQIITVVILALHFFGKRENFFFKLWEKHGLLFSFLIVLVGTIGSLIYSDVFGYLPCKLCWFERIFMYPQVVILLVALKKKDGSELFYAFWLSILGAAISLYHHLIQIGVFPESGFCSIGATGDCSKLFVSTFFGYVTIPMMAFSAFILVAVTAYVGFARQKNNVTLPQ